MNDDRFDVVLDVLQKHHDKLMNMTMANMNSEFIGLNIMDDIRLNQIEELKEAMRIWNKHKETR